MLQPEQQPPLVGCAASSLSMEAGGAPYAFYILFGAAFSAGYYYGEFPAFKSLICYFSYWLSRGSISPVLGFSDAG